MDSIIEQIQDFGPFQKKQTYILLVLTWMVIGMNTLQILFLSKEPPEKRAICMSLPDIQQYNAQHDWNDRIVIPWDFKGYENTLTVCNEGEGMEPSNCNFPHQFLPPNRFLMLKWKLTHCEVDQSKMLQKVENASFFYFSGFLVGLILCGYLSDLYGRRVIYTVSVSILALLSLLVTPLSVNVKVYFGFRLLFGFACGSLSVNVLLLILENSSQQHNAHVNVFTSIAFAIGVSVMSGFSMLITNNYFVFWGVIDGFHLLLLAVALFYPNLLTESVRWLFSKKKWQKTHDVLKIIAEENGRALDPHITPDYLQHLFHQHGEQQNNLHESLLTSSIQFFTQSARSNAPLSHRSESKSPMASETTPLLRNVSTLDKSKSNPLNLSAGPSDVPWDVFVAPPLNKQLFSLLLAWFATSLGYYGLSLNINTLPGNLEVNTIIACLSEIPIYFFSNLLANNAGRKSALMLFLGGCVVLSGASLCVEPTWSIYGALNICCRLFYAAAYNICYLFGTESFPTSVRSFAMGLQSASARVGSILCVFFLSFHTTQEISQSLITIMAMNILAVLLLGYLSIDSTLVFDTINDYQEHNNENGAGQRIGVSPDSCLSSYLPLYIKGSKE